MGRSEKMKKFIGFKDASCDGKEFIRCMVAEFIGTMFLIIIGCGSCIEGWSVDYRASVVQISFAFGLTVATMVQCIGHVSGGHINPAVTAGMVMAGKCSLLRALAYVLSQLLGGLVGAALLKAITPSEFKSSLGMTIVSEQITAAQGFGVEYLITFVLVLTVFAVTDGNRFDIKGSAPLAIGLSVATCHLLAVKFTGASMNTARSFGPAVVTGLWADHWVFWFGPILGGLTAGGIYTLLFQGQSNDTILQAIQNNGNETEVIADRTTSI